MTSFVARSVESFASGSEQMRGGSRRRVVAAERFEHVDLHGEVQAT
jgi:hypothetical protein